MLGCPGCGQPLRPWGHGRERTVRGTGGTQLTFRPDRALCTGCTATHTCCWTPGCCPAALTPPA
jgi:hypothetical protein